jgi:hypothetical protein
MTQEECDHRLAHGADPIQLTIEKYTGLVDALEADDFEEASEHWPEAVNCPLCWSFGRIARRKITDCGDCPLSKTEIVSDFEANCTEDGCWYTEICEQITRCSAYPVKPHIDDLRALCAGFVDLLEKLA